MKFTIDADSDLARDIQARCDTTDMTLSIVAHDKTFTDVEKLTTARLMKWTVRSSCDHRGCTGCHRVMDVEWSDADVFAKMVEWPTMPELT